MVSQVQVHNTAGPLFDDHDFSDDDNWQGSDEPTPPTTSQSSSISLEDLQNAAALWILKAREINRLPFSVMDNTMADVHSLHLVSLDPVRERIKERLTSAEVEHSVIQEVMFEFNESGPYLNMFNGLQTQAQQMSDFRQNFDLVVSQYNYIIIIIII